MIQPLTGRVEPTSSGDVGDCLPPISPFQKLLQVSHVPVEESEQVERKRELPMKKEAETLEFEVWPKLLDTANEFQE